MKFKSLITLALLFVFSFSIVHEYEFTSHDNNHCAGVEHVHELSLPTLDANICDAHCKYHQSFVLSQNIIVANIEYISLINTINKESYDFQTHLEFFKPPIA